MNFETPVDINVDETTKLSKYFYPFRIFNFTNFDKKLFFTNMWKKDLKAPAGFDLMTCIFVVNALTVCASNTLSDNYTSDKVAFLHSSKVHLSTIAQRVYYNIHFCYWCISPACKRDIYLPFKNKFLQENNFSYRETIFLSNIWNFLLKQRSFL